MKPRTLLVLFVVVAALGAFIWFYERELPSGEERAELAKKVLRLEAEEVEAVEVEWQGRTLRLERVQAPEPAEGAAEKKAAEDEDGEEEADDLADLPEETAWRIARPLFSGRPARADAAAVSRLLDTLLDLRKERTLEEYVPREVGLDKPRGKVKLATGDGERVLSIGAAVPTGARMIVAVEGDGEAHVVDDQILAELEKDPGEWRDREVFPGERGDIQRITLHGGEGGPVVLARQGETFRVARPFADRADRDLVDSLLTDLAGLRAERFLDQDADQAAAPPDPAALGLQPPARSIEVAFSGGTPPARIDLGRTDEESGLTAARIGPQLFETRSGLAEAAGNPPSAWRSPAWTSLEVYEIDRARFTDPSGPVEVVRADADWKRGNDLVSFTTVSDVLFALTAAKADALLSPEEARARGLDLAKPTLSIALNGGAGRPKGETLTLYPPKDAAVPARASGRNVVLLLPEEQANDVRTRLADLRQAEPLPPAESVGKEEAEGEQSP